MPPVNPVETGHQRPILSEAGLEGVMRLDEERRPGDMLLAGKVHPAQVFLGRIQRIGTRFGGGQRAVDHDDGQDHHCQKKSTYPAHNPNVSSAVEQNGERGS